MTRSTKNLLLWGVLLAGGYYLYTQMGAASGASTVAGMGRWRRKRRAIGYGGGGQAGGGGGQSQDAFSSDTQDASSFDPLGVELENEQGYS